jgi:hypothetical protein
LDGLEERENGRFYYCSKDGDSESEG